ncbi:unnamed protein product [Cyclocybe aegerita]|uniref:RCC1-like domain-containing protein n=1 Tax=Cyclocybe aegerita TaxID=1973307 RepID=A0A8S0WHV8_CYCAE|nr:unnamed protein product [Cyclocybe aegerita]
MPVARTQKHKPARATNSRTRGRTSTKPTPSKSFLNSLPTARNASLNDSLLIHGEPTANQFGLGTRDRDQLRERPAVHRVVKQMIQRGELGPNGIEQVAAGGMHSLILDSLGRVWSSGCNDEDALGRRVEVQGEDASELEAKFALVEGLEGFRTVRIAASDNASFALNEKGELRAWGTFKAKKSGDRGFSYEHNLERSLKPIAFSVFVKDLISSICCGHNHVLALTASGRVYTWGTPEDGQLGRRILPRFQSWTYRPTPIMRNIVAIGSAASTSFAVDKVGNVYAFGKNSERQAGVDGERNIIDVPTPISALHPLQHGGARVVQITGGDEHSVFLFDNGQMWTCGWADDFRLGLSLEALMKYMAPGSDLATRRPEGVPYSWGCGVSHQLGLPGASEIAEVPTKITSEDLEQRRVLQISAGGEHVMFM